jgi:hypothetical protein
LFPLNLSLSPDVVSFSDYPLSYISAKMALAPRFAGQKFFAASTPTLHTLERKFYFPILILVLIPIFNALYRRVRWGNSRPSPLSSQRQHIRQRRANSTTVYLDYVCPFSQKMFNTLYSSVLPLVKQKYASKVQILFRQQIQPWHPSSTLVHEAGVAVLKLDSAKFWEFSKVNFPKLHFRSQDIDGILIDNFPGSIR